MYRINVDSYSIITILKCLATLAEFTALILILKRQYRNDNNGLVETHSDSRTSPITSVIRSILIQNNAGVVELCGWKKHR